MNYKFIFLLAFCMLSCNSAAQTILEIAENESMLFDSEPELMGTYYVDNSKYYIVKHNNPFVSGISIYDEYGMKIEDESLAEKIIIAHRVKVGNETMEVLENYTRAVLLIDSQIASVVQSLNYLIYKLDRKQTDVDYGEVKTFFEILNSLKNSTGAGALSCGSVVSNINYLEKNKDYATAYRVIEEYEKCISSIEPTKSNLENFKKHVGPASETLNSPEVLKLALGNDNLSREISLGLDSSIQQVDKLKNSSSLESIDDLDTGILKKSYEKIKSGIDSEIAGFETRIDPQPRILTIIGILILLIIGVIVALIVKKKGIEIKDFKFRKEKESKVTSFGDLTIVVTESKTRDPVENAGISLVNSKTKDKYEGKTDGIGNLILRDMIAGDYEMEIKSSKHETENTDVSVDPGINRSMIVLKRK
ncbi:hypothetical protein BEH94_09120 [Candidatus Altiarchaeales archaeon WOR_SM1_SCG]|nr:hypothetical protein BEH94_09120 [Candidatus Altiarchaeales archaeon WOR_SM1_SCG]